MGNKTGIEAAVVKETGKKKTINKGVAVIVKLHFDNLFSVRDDDSEEFAKQVKEMLQEVLKAGDQLKIEVKKLDRKSGKEIPKLQNQLTLQADEKGLVKVSVERIVRVSEKVETAEVLKNQ